ncbi:MAG TPA: PDZ domain-containing protein, partial [Pyrinomonadaceae bacterium]|nr:PDZ domain-containing protein [Pyrinomonadaceae bacterium]
MEKTADYSFLQTIENLITTLGTARIAENDVNRVCPVASRLLPLQFVSFMKNKPAFLLLLVLLESLAAFAQPKLNGVSQFPAVEPFKIARGSSFAASTPNGGRQNRAELSPERKKESVARDFSDALLLVKNNYAGGKQIDYNELTKSSIKGMLRALDPHSNYYDAAAYQNLLEDQQSQYFGIGASIVNYRKNGVTDTFVTSTFPDSPAFRGNLRFGDKILAVNGEDVSGRDSGYVRDKVRGRKGSIVRLTIERAD